MAAFGANKTESFLGLVNALLKSDGQFINRLNQTAMLPSMVRSGAVTARITTTVTPGDIADGTMATNGAARTEVALTAFRKQHAIKLFPDEVGQFLNEPEAMIREAQQFAAGANVLMEGEIIADLVAGTPGHTSTLTTGQIDFLTDGTDAEAYDNLNELDKAIGYMRANTGGYDDALTIIMPTTAYSNFTTLLGSSRYGANIWVQNGQALGKRHLVYQGIPIFPTTVTTNFGGAGKECAFVVHRDAEAVLWQGAEFHGAVTGEAPFRAFDDGLYGAILQAYGYAGLVQALYAAVLNPTA